jgi:hypothetical protein
VTRLQGGAPHALDGLLGQEEPMTDDPRASETTPLNPPDVSTGTKRRQLEGEEAPEDQDGALDIDEVETADPVTDTEILEGAAVDPRSAAEREAVESLTSLGLGADATSNPDVAAEEGETWVPPVDPPVVPDADAPEGIAVAAGFGVSALDEPFDADHHSTLLPADDEVSARVHEALRADARTSRLADGIRVETGGGVVVLRGVVEDIEDGELLAEVASDVEGVAEVYDETEVPGL